MTRRIGDVKRFGPPGNAQQLFPLHDEMHHMQDRLRDPPRNGVELIGLTGAHTHDQSSQVAAISVKNECPCDHDSPWRLRQWQYRPLILNGLPEPFVLTVVLTFELVETS